MDKSAQQEAVALDPALPPRPEEPWLLAHGALISAASAAVIAIYWSFQFRRHLPFSEQMAGIQDKWWLLSLVTAVLGVGEPIIGQILGGGVFAFSAQMGTEWALLGALLFHFWRQNNPGGMCFVLFWEGTSLFSDSFYAADVQRGLLPEIREEIGMETALNRDWFGFLESLGLTRYCVGVGQLLFFCSWWLMSFAVLYGACLIWRRIRHRGSLES